MRNAAVATVAAAAFAVVVTAVVLNNLFVARLSTQADSVADLWSSVVIALLLLGGGSIVALRVPRNPVGWLLLLLLATALTLQRGCGEAARVAVADSETRTGAAVWALLSECLVRPQVTAVLLIVLLFPTGRPLLRRWRPVVAAVAAVGAASFVVHLLSPLPLQFAQFRGVAAPLGLAALAPVTDKHVFLPLTAVLGVLAVASLAIRVRRSRGVERQQPKWVGFVAAGVPVCIAWIAVASIWGPSATNVAGDAMFYVIELAVPAAVNVAITRHRLNDLNLLVNRTVVYAALSVTLLTTYGAVVLLTTRVFVSAGWRSLMVVALGTLVTTLAALPLRRRIQDTVDRLFHRRAWAASRQIGAYAQRARHVPQSPYAMREVLRAATADHTLEVAFRIRETGRWVDGGGRPAEGAPGRAERLVNDADGAPMAALIHAPDRGRDLRLWASVVDAAALLLANGRLQAKVRAQLAEVQASRSRIIAAADAERRRVERDLHDGAQQRLLGIALQIRLAASPQRLPDRVRGRGSGGGERVNQAGCVEGFGVLSEGGAGVDDGAADLLAVGEAGWTGRTHRRRRGIGVALKLPVLMLSALFGRRKHDRRLRGRIVAAALRSRCIAVAGVSAGRAMPIHRFVKDFSAVRWSGRWPALMTTVLVVAVGVLVAIGVGLGLQHSQRHASVQQMQSRSQMVADAVTAQSGRYLDALRTVASATGAFDHLTATKFDQVTAALVNSRLAGATSITFMVPVAERQVAATQALWRSRGATGLQFVPAHGREHIFSVFSRALDGSTLRRTGIDAIRSRPATRALDQARSSGQAAMSDPYQLIIDQQLPAVRRQLSFTVTAPVYGPADAYGQRPFRGWVLMGLRGRDFMTATIDESAQSLLDVSLTAPSSDGTYQQVAEYHTRLIGQRDLAFDTTVSVAGRDWRLHFRAAAHDLPGGITHVPLLTGVGLVLLDLLLAALTWTLAAGRSRALRQVHAATTELTNAERAARHQADLLKAILDSISDGVRVVDPDGNVLVHNPAAQSIIGDAADAYIATSKPVSRGLFRPDGTPIPMAQTPLMRALRGEPADREELLVRSSNHPDGIAIAVSARPVRGGADSLGAVAVFHDITARKAAEAQLAASRDELQDQQAYLTQILDAIDVTIVTCRPDGTIAHANRAARDVLDVDNASTPPVSMSTIALSHLDGSAVTAKQSPLHRALAGEHVDAMEISVTLPDGRQRSLLTQSRPLHDSTGTITGAVAASYDVTTLREREADLHAFAVVAAHDLKAPLAVIAGYAEILNEALGDVSDPTMRNSLHRISAGIDRMRRLIDDLLSYATTRDCVLNLQPVDLNHLVAEVITERTAHLHLTATDHSTPSPDIHTGPLPTVHVDLAMMRKLLDKLLHNALKYTLPGQPARIDIAAHPGDSHTHFEITDRGIGIASGDQPHIFDTFHRSTNQGNRPGTGLGLAICKRIIERHHGTIEVSDNPGGGARFRVTLPNRPPHSAASSSTSTN